VWALVVLASLLAFVSALSLWVDRQFLDNGSFKRSSAQLIRNPTIQSTLSTFLVDQLYSNVNVSAEIEKRLPSQFKQLASPAAAALRQPAALGVQFLLTEPRVQQSWIQASSLADEQLIAVLENKTGHGISTGNGVVTADLSQLVKELGADLGLPSSALDKIPANAGTVTIMRSNQLSTAQTAVQGIRAASIWLIVVVLALYALAIYLARGRRRETLRTIGWALALVGLLLLVVRAVTGTYVVDALAPTTYRDAAHVVWQVQSSFLGEIAGDLVFYGLVVVLGALLAGPTRVATLARRESAPMLKEHAGASWGILAFAYLLLVLWGPTPALRSPWGILFLAGLVALGFYFLRRQTLAEHPDAAFTGRAAAALHSLREQAVAHRPALHLPRHEGDDGHAAAAAPAPATAPAPAPAGRSLGEDLARLHELHQAGALTDEEFAEAKRVTLGAS
jgi:hypothetical protein